MDWPLYNSLQNAKNSADVSHHLLFCNCG